MTIIRVVDFETTGTDPEKDGAQVCEVGTCDLALVERHVLRPRSWLCRVQTMPPEVRAIHHITLAECQEWDEFNPNMLDGTGIDAFAAHNSSFETKFWTPDKPMICTYKAALRVWPDAPSHSNGSLRYWLQDQGKINPDHLTTQPAHRAGPDAYVTAWLLLALFDAGATGKQMAQWTKEPRLMNRCPIGKFKGMPWSEVEDGFLGWMMRQADMEPDLKWNAAREIERRQGATA